MTKLEMLNYIARSGIVVDFDYKYLMTRSKNYITQLYNRAVAYAANSK